MPTLHFFFWNSIFFSSCPVSSICILESNSIWIVYGFRFKRNKWLQVCIDCCVWNGIRIELTGWPTASVTGALDMLIRIELSSKCQKWKIAAKVNSFSWNKEFLLKKIHETEKNDKKKTNCRVELLARLDFAVTDSIRIKPDLYRKEPDHVGTSQSAIPRKTAREVSLIWVNLFRRPGIQVRNM